MKIFIESGKKNQAAKVILICEHAEVNDLLSALHFYHEHAPVSAPRKARAMGYMAQLHDASRATVQTRP